MTPDGRTTPKQYPPICLRKVGDKKLGLNYFDHAKETQSKMTDGQVDTAPLFIRKTSQESMIMLR